MRLVCPFALTTALGVLMTFPSSFAQTSTAPPRGKVERIKVHAKSLEGNLEGDSPDREVSVYLPPGYKAKGRKRYPVVYMLHGFTDSDEQWFGFKKHWINLADVLDKSFANAGVHDMIVVMPNAFTAYQGSMYSSSVTTGDWEDFVARELVAYVDSHYRTIPKLGSRGLAGHSMGGYGTIRIGMKHPEVFSSLYMLSPCCMTPPATQGPAAAMTVQAEAVHSLDEVAKADFMTKIVLASAAAWSPNPLQPPLFLDLLTKGGQIQPQIAAKWAANAPLSMIDQYIPNLKRLHAIAFDAGTQDTEIASDIQVLDQVLKSYRIPHTFETYEGDHINRVAERIETKAIPFFSANLSR